MAVIYAASMIWGSIPLYAHADPGEGVLEDYLLNYRQFSGEHAGISIAGWDGGTYTNSGATIPSRYDNKDFASYMPKLRNQGTYGSCWAQTAMALAEIGMRKKGLLTAANFSEVQLSYFTYNSVPDPLGGTDKDKNKGLFSAKNYLKYGGNLEMAATVLSGWVGASSEAGELAYPSASKKPPSKLDDAYAYYYDAAHLRGFYNVCIDESEGINSEDMRAAKTVIMEKGGLGAGYYALNATKASTSPKIYNKRNNAYYDPDPHGMVANHSVTIVGWDDDFPASSFSKRPPGNGAWLIRNSWASGDFKKNQKYAGYFWMSYYNASLCSGALAFDMDPATDYDNNYQYDGAMTTDEMWKRDVHEAKEANVFKAKACPGGESLQAVSFVSSMVNADYEVRIYVSDSPITKDPETGELKATLKGRTTFTGYYTLDLEKPISLSPGQYFSVVVSFCTPDRNTRIAFEQSDHAEGWYRTTAHIDTGQSFVSFSGGWKDVVTFKKREDRPDLGNVRIKAFTDNSTHGRIEPDTRSLTLRTGKKKSVGINVYSDSVKMAASSDSKVASASVSGNNVIIKAGKKKGTATVTVISGTGRRESLRVNVQTGKVTTKKLTLSGGRKTLTGYGQSLKLKAVATPDRYSTGETFKVYTSSKKVATATVNKQTGEVIVTSGQRKGTATITVKCGSKRASCKVTVKN